jgi:dienelactone hydrolase
MTRAKRLRETLWLAAFWLVVAAVFSAQAADLSRRGPYQVGEFTEMVVRDDGTFFDALVFFPADPMAPAQPDLRAEPSTIIVFAHGFLSPPELYRVTCRHLASWGYVVIAPRSGLELFPDHARYANDLSIAAQHLVDVWTNDPGSPFHVFVESDRFGVTGHSMGGGASLLAAAQDARFVAVAPIAAAETRPSAIASVPLIEAPICYITGSEDSFVPNPFHTGRMYRNTTAPAAWFDIIGGYHCGFILPPLPSAVCDEGSISRITQIEKTHNLLTAFFNLTLRGDDASWYVVWGPNAGLDKSITVRHKRSAELVTPSRWMTVIPGTTQTMMVQIRNTGSVTGTFTLKSDFSGFPVEIDANEWVLSPGEISPGIPVRVTVPASGRMKRSVMLLRAADIAGGGGDYQWLFLVTRR